MYFCIFVLFFLETVERGSLVLPLNSGRALLAVSLFPTKFRNNIWECLCLVCTYVQKLVNLKTDVLRNNYFLSSTVLSIKSPAFFFLKTKQTTTQSLSSKVVALIQETFHPVCFLQINSEAMKNSSAPKQFTVTATVLCILKQTIIRILFYVPYILE